MSNENDLDYILDVLLSVDETLEKTKKRVKHGRPRIQRRKIKSQVLKGHTPTDIKRHRICAKAREKAHSVTANSNRHISNNVRRGLHEGLPLVNENALTLSERYDFDFIEEAEGYDLCFEWFDRPKNTAITESYAQELNLPITCIGIAEGVFAPITDAEGNSIFSRNNRLYIPPFWEYQLYERHLADRVATRGVVGTIGHHDKRVDDQDFAEGKVSHIISALEIREDERGKYLWGRLEIIGTPAGKLLKTYYDNKIPMYVSSRGGGKLLDVPGKQYKVVDIKRYYCECFDVVHNPGFLQARPEYIYINHDIQDEKCNEAYTFIQDRVVEDTATPQEGYIEIQENEDDNMAKVNCKITAETDMSQIVQDMIKPMSEKLSELTDTVSALAAEVFETEETSVENQAEEAPVAEATPEVGEEPAAEEPKVEEKPAEEQPAEAPVAEGEAPVAEETSVEEPANENTEEAPVAEETTEEAPVVEETTNEEADDVVEKCDKCGKEKCECGKKDEKGQAEGEEEGKKKVDEEWAHIDPKENVPASNTEPKAEVGQAPAGLGDSYAKEDPKEELPKVAGSTEGEEPKKERQDGEEKQVNANSTIIKEGEEAPAEQAPAEAPVENVIDYKSMYENLQSEVDDAINTIDEMIETFRDFGKKYREVVLESKNIQQNLQEQLDNVTKQLNSYKLVEKFNITIDKANELLNSQSYENVEEGLKAEEAKKAEEEAQAKVEQVSESVAEPIVENHAPAKKRKVSSVFSANSTEENINEGKTPSKSKGFSWFS